MKPYSESCVQNREPIFKIIQPLFAKRKNLLEIGSGTGQHAVYFAKELPHLNWQTSDIQENHEGINQWLDEAQLDNIKRPLSLAACDRESWTKLEGDDYYDAVFSANAVHIMGEVDVQCLIINVGETLANMGLFVLYGPFNYEGKYTCESNERFDVWLKDRDPKSGIRDFEWIDELANKAGLTLQHDFEMPANNRILVWQK